MVRLESEREAIGALHHPDGDGLIQIGVDDVPREVAERAVSGHPYAYIPDEGGEDTPLAEREYSELREMAKNADSEEVNGRSSKDDIVAFFSDDA